MAKSTITEGICLYCSKSYPGITMTRHLESCEKRKNFYLEMNNKISQGIFDKKRDYVYKYRYN